MRNLTRQRGEGKIGCIISLIILVTLIGAAFRFVPVYFSNNEFITAVEGIAGRAAALTPEAIQIQINQKARELQIPEALTPGSIVVTKVGDHLEGSCTVKIKYTRKIDFYGIMTYPLETNKTKTIPYMDGR